MARVVAQRRSNPPYLLILFVFLFLLSTVAAVMFYINWDKANKELATERTDTKKIVGTSDETDPNIKALIDNYTTSKDPVAMRRTVVGELKYQVQRLAEAIDFQTKTYDTAKASMDKMYEGNYQPNDRPSLLALVKREKEAAATLQTRVDELAAERKAVDAEKTKLVADMADLKTKQKADLDALSKQLEAVQKKATDDQAAYIAAMEKVTKEHKAKLAEYEANINDKLSKIKTLTDKNTELANQNVVLKDEITRLRGGNTGLVLKADGKIVKLVDGQKIAYVSIGAKDNVRVGLTLAVFPFTGIPEDPNTPPKGKLRVVNVSPDVSECAITDESDKDPLVVDDLVANLAHDTSRAYTFVVEGMFDLRGTGTPSPTGADEARELIRQAGSKLTDTVDIHCDYVVLGNPPTPPSKPADDAQPQVKKIYAEQLKALDRYNEVKREAEGMRIPILNTNRFLNVMGYVAPKAVK